jgi:acyl carrier protein
MSLPQAVVDFLNNSAEANGATQPGSTDDLFTSGTLDSFALVDFITLLEDHCDIRVPDAEVIPANFRTIEAIDEYVQSRKQLAA